MKLVLTQKADQDIEAIADYIAQDSPRPDVKWVDEVEEKLKALAISPGMGRDRSDVLTDLWTFAFGKYLICYRPISKGAEILRVFHGSRQWQDLL